MPSGYGPIVTIVMIDGAAVFPIDPRRLRGHAHAQRRESPVQPSSRRVAACEAAAVVVSLSIGGSFPGVAKAGGFHHDYQGHSDIERRSIVRRQ